MNFVHFFFQNDLYKNYILFICKIIELLLSNAYRGGISHDGSCQTGSGASFSGGVHGDRGHVLYEFQ